MKLFDLGPGPALLAIATLGLGVLTLIYRDFALNWQPIPGSMPAREALVFVSAFSLLASGIGILMQRIAARSALFLFGYLLVFWVIPHLITVVPNFKSIGPWLGLCESLGVLSGAWLLWAQLTDSPIDSAQNVDFRRNSIRAFRRLFGLCCVIYGVSHFVYADFTAGMIPQWFPQRLWLAYATGAAHAAAGLGMVLGIYPRLAAILEAAMMSAFVVVLHIPSLWTQPPPAWGPTLRTELTPLFWATALAASAWLVARSYTLLMSRQSAR
jgi:uncharacterized membrane protein